MLSTIFRGAKVYDGGGGPPRTLDVATYGDRVALIGRLEDRDAAAVIACEGLALAPGFIDAHSHTDERWLAEPRVESKLRQGVTTEIGGNCGYSAAPLTAEALRAERAARLAPMRVEPHWTTLDEFLTLVEHERPAINVATLVGLGTTRANVAGEDADPLDREQLAAQARLVREAVEAGALGVSSGLVYPPGSYADATELATMARAAADSGAALYATHLRSEGDALIPALEEALRIGRDAGVTVQISHHKACGRRNWGRVHQSLAMIDAARDAGEPVFADAYPYLGVWTELAQILPGEARRGGIEATLEGLRDPQRRAATALAVELAWGGRWHEILITDVGSSRNEELAGLRIDELGRRWGVKPVAAALRLLTQQRLSPQAIFFELTQSDIDAVFSARFVAIASDAAARAVTGVTACGLVHPRAFGTFPRAIGRYSRRRGIYEIAEGIRRATSLPAAIFGLRDRGRIVEGAFADLVLFDDAALTDRATYEQPTLFPEGIREVYVNGACVLRDGRLSGARPGRVLRR
ncbi:MAG: amidohydrolase family protein [bacterium]|nr:amidohydrolase family protein [bacterium]